MSDPVTTTQLPQANPSVASDDRSVGVVAPTVVQSIASAPPQASSSQSSTPQTSARAKERGSVSVAEAKPLVEMATGTASLEQEAIPPEVEAWMEKVTPGEEAIKLENLPQVQIQTPAPSVTSSGKPAFVLPLGEAEMKTGMKASVNDSIRWLTTWCQKIMKQLKGQVVFRA